MWIKKDSLWRDVDHGLLIFNFGVAWVPEGVKTSGMRTASWRGGPRFWVICSLQADRHSLLFTARAFGHPVFAARKPCGSGLSPLPPSLLCFPHHTPCSSSVPSAFPALGCHLWWVTVQWSHSLCYPFNWDVSSSKQGLQVYVFFPPFGAWCRTHSTCSVRTIGWLLPGGYLSVLASFLVKDKVIMRRLPALECRI